MKQIIIKKLGYTIVVHFDGQSGNISSDLRDGLDEGQWSDLEAATDAIESLILAHACAGVDIQSHGYLKGLEVSLEKIFNKYE